MEEMSGTRSSRRGREDREEEERSTWCCGGGGTKRRRGVHSWKEVRRSRVEGRKEGARVTLFKAVTRSESEIKSVELSRESRKVWRFGRI